MKIATFNVHYVLEAEKIGKFLIDHNIDVCGMQEVAGDKSLKKLPAEYTKLFDYGYRTFGTGLVYLTHKFKLISSNTNVIKHGGGKKTVFTVVLRHKQSNKVFTFCVTHLDHRTEQSRLQEWNNFLKIKPDTPHIVLADMNALVMSDYTKEKWDEISQIRQKNNWESPKTELMSTVAKDYHDALGLLGNSSSTCRFNTRIDYILFSKQPENHLLDYAESIQVVDTGDASDHYPVVCSLNF